MSAQLEAPSVMQSLRESTQALHDQTEAGAFNEELVKGRLPLDRYVESLAQLLLIHRAFEQALLRQRIRVPAIDRVLRDYHIQEPYLRTDLAHFRRSEGSIIPMPATTKMIERIHQVEAEHPIGLLGFLYVFEGSNNGSKFISKAVRRAYSLNDTEGTQYLDPYGDRQREYWQAFKDDMNKTDFTAADRAAIVAAATTTFAGVMQLHRELHEGVVAEPKPAAASSGGCPFHQAAAKN